MAKTFTFTSSRLLEIVHDIESTEDKVLKSDPNLERSMTIQQCLKKMLTMYHKVYNKKALTVPTTPDKYFTKKENALILNFPVFIYLVC